MECNSASSTIHSWKFYGEAIRPNKTHPKQFEARPPTTTRTTPNQLNSMKDSIGPPSGPLERGAPLHFPSGFLVSFGHGLVLFQVL